MKSVYFLNEYNEKNDASEEEREDHKCLKIFKKCKKNWQLEIVVSILKKRGEVTCEKE